MIDTQKTGRFIAQCRKEKKLTQKQLGEYLGVTDRAVSKWETGRSFPDVSVMEQLCDILEINISELLAGERIEPENYQAETESMLMMAVSERQLYGFQIVIYLLTLCGVVLVLLPFLQDTAGSVIPTMTFDNIACWILALVISGIGSYLDQKLPARKYRYSYAGLAVTKGVLYFSIVAFVNIKIMIRNGMPTGNDFITIVMMYLMGYVIVIGISILRARHRRQEAKTDV